jgi:hypothetical protein
MWRCDRQSLKGPFRSLAVALGVVGFAIEVQSAGQTIFNVRHYGATGQPGDDARPGIQQAIDRCAAAGGGTVLIPPGQYTSGTLRLRSRVRLVLEAGAVVRAASDPAAYPFDAQPSKAALLWGEDLEAVTIEGRGTLGGQAQYEWREDDWERAFEHKQLMQQLGGSLRRPFPAGFPQRRLFPHLIWLGRCKDVRLSGLTLTSAPGWAVALYDCQRVRCQHLHIYSSLQEAVWSDGIDLDGCADVSISDCTIQTGDDCVALSSTDVWGPARPCRNVTVTRCRLASASAGIKLSEGNRAGVHDVRVTGCQLGPVNRGAVLSTALGGFIRDVVLADLTIQCRRYDWFWAGDGQPFDLRTCRLSEFNKQPPQAGEPEPGLIQCVTIRNVTAQAQGSSRIHGHPDRWLDRIRLESLRLSLTADPAAPFDLARHALDLRWARNLLLQNVEVHWGQPALHAWQSALQFQHVTGLTVDRFTGRSAWPDQGSPAIGFEHVHQARLRRCRAAEGTGLFLKIQGQGSGLIVLENNDLRQAKVPWQLSPEVAPGAIRTTGNRLPPECRPRWGVSGFSRRPVPAPACQP